MGGFELTFVWVTSLNVSGDTDNSQGVDAGKAEEQREEAVYLEADRETEGEGLVSHDMTSLKCL